MSDTTKLGSEPPIADAWQRALMDYAVSGRQVVLTLDAFEAFIVLSNLQLALRHPRNTGESVEYAQAVCGRLVAAIATDEDSPLRALCMAGFDEHFDTVDE